MKDNRRLFGYWRSTATYRVRIALNWKGVEAQVIPVNLRANEQRDPAFREVNPSGLVPVFETEGVRLTQSLAIIEYLEEIMPLPPLLPGSPLMRAEIRELALDVVADLPSRPQSARRMESSLDRRRFLRNRGAFGEVRRSFRLRRSADLGRCLLGAPGLQRASL